MTITMKEVHEYKKLVEERKRTSTPQEARERLIASGALKSDGSPMTQADYDECWIGMTE